MRLPWIARGSHEAIVSIFSAQLAELKDERRLLLDRLAILGLGGPIFQVPAAEETNGAVETPELADPEGEMLAELARFKRRPSRLADELTRRAFREHSKRGAGPKVAWIPAVDKISAALDEAEARGKHVNGN